MGRTFEGNKIFFVVGTEKTVQLESYSQAV
jgi:hypothetical protein